MKILVLSREAWRDEENGGNVLSNLFSCIDAEFAQIYCSGNEPNNMVCKSYYQISDRMIIDNVLHKQNVGRVKKYNQYPCEEKKDEYKGIKKYNFELVRVAREIAWKIANLDVGAIKTYITTFNPDIVFAPCYGSHYMIYLTRLIHDTVDAPIISYISDDFFKFVSICSLLLVISLNFSFIDFCCNSLKIF